MYTTSRIGSRGRLASRSVGRLAGAADVSWWIVTSEPTETSLDPYRAPAVTEIVAPGLEDQAGSFATRVSVILAVVAVALFWGVLLLVRIMPWEYKPTALGIGWAVTIASTLHLLGLGVVFAAPRGRRLIGLTANAVGLSSMLGLIALVFR